LGLNSPGKIKINNLLLYIRNNFGVKF